MFLQFEHEFKNYGKGLRKIKFSHGGQDSQFWAGHYGSKMAGACVRMEVPDGLPQEGPEQQEQTNCPEPYYPPEDYPPEPYFLREEESDSEEYDSEG